MIDFFFFFFKVHKYWTFFFFFFNLITHLIRKLKILNWACGIKLDNSWNPIWNLIGFSFNFNFIYIRKITFYHFKLYLWLYFAPQTIRMHVLHHKLWSLLHFHLYIKSAANLDGNAWHHLKISKYLSSQSFKNKWENTLYPSKLYS